MKRLAYTIFAAVIILSGTLSASAQEQTRQVSGFNSISSAGPFDVHVKINGTESLKIAASPDIINEIETVVEDGKLEIKFKHRNERNREDYSKIDIYVTAKSLSSLANAGSGAIKVDGTLSGNKVDLILSGSGNISSSVKSGELHAVISGSGSINLYGSSDDAHVQISGSGELLGKEFKTNSASVNITGSGSAHIMAEKNISTRIVGSGNVVYSGNATVDSKTVGSGRVSKAD